MVLMHFDRVHATVVPYGKMLSQTISSHHRISCKQQSFKFSVLPKKMHQYIGVVALTTLLLFVQALENGWCSTPPDHDQH